jgi:hypothetical protein
MKLLPRVLRTFVLILSTLYVCPGIGFAQTDEIQVYDASIAEPGIFNLTWHNNFIADGLKTPAFPGGLIPDISNNVGPVISNNVGPVISNNVGPVKYFLSVLLRSLRRGVFLVLF